jgi:hypothetical protein
VEPDSGSATPSGLEIFSFRSGSIRITEAAVSPSSVATSFSLYAEAAGSFNTRHAGSLRTGFALRNVSQTETVVVTLELFSLSGYATGYWTEIFVAPNSQLVRFVEFSYPIPWLPFRGTLRIRSTGPIAAFGLRCRYNERGELLTTTTTPFDGVISEPATGKLFPHFVEGGGYTTEFLLLGRSEDPGSSGELRFFSQSGQPLNLEFR